MYKATLITASLFFLSPLVAGQAPPLPDPKLADHFPKHGQPSGINLTVFANNNCAPEDTTYQLLAPDMKWGDQLFHPDANGNNQSIKSFKVEGNTSPMEVVVYNFENYTANPRSYHEIAGPFTGSVPSGVSKPGFKPPPGCTVVDFTTDAWNGTAWTIALETTH